MVPVPISAVIPAFNRGHLISRAIESVLAQTFPAAEIIVVDDGSTDDTAARVRVFGEKVRYLCQQNAGASSARNSGVSEARCAWVAFLDSDDVWFPGHLERIAAAITATGGAAGFYFADMLEDHGPAGGGLWEHCRFRVEGDFRLVQDATDWAMMERQPMMIQSSVFHRERFLAAGGFWKDLPTTEDTHLFLKMSIGAPACAVAGFGGELLDDEFPERRLSLAHGAGNPRHWVSALCLWEDILSRFPDLPPAHRRTLLDRCATSHRNLAAIALAARRPARVLIEAARYGRDRLRALNVRRIPAG